MNYSPLASVFDLDSFVKESRLKRDVELQPHQERVKKKLENSDALLLYHGLGSGKTLSAIAATEGTPTDVIVPASLRGNFAKEVKKFTDKKTPRNVMSYEKATKGLEPKEALILDEAHRLGNSGTSRAQAILEQAPKYKKRVLLTGTPIRNYPHELATLSRILDPTNKALPLDPTAFDKEFIETVKVSPGIINRLIFGVKPGNEYRAKNLKKIRDVFSGKVDYHAPDTSMFPERTDKVVAVPMSNKQENIYRTVTNHANPILATKVRMDFPLNKKEQSQLNAFLTAARVVSNSPRSFGGQEFSPKFLRAVEDFKEALKSNPNHKALTYSNYLDSGVNEYAKLLEQAKIPHGVFHGGLSDKERKELVDSYNSGKIKNLLITGAGSEGLDLKGTRMIQLLEPHWNSPRLEQAAGRGIRFGSHEDLPEDQRNVEVIKYLSTMNRNLWQKLWGKKPYTSVDEYLLNLSKKKEDLNNQFLQVLKAEGSK